jgi:hypothetical protein
VAYKAHLRTTDETTDTEAVLTEMGQALQASEDVPYRQERSLTI